MLFKRILLTALCASLMLSSCAAPAGQTDMTENLQTPPDSTAVFPLAAAAAEPIGTPSDDRFAGAVQTFSERLFSLCAEDAKNKNLVLSPLSVIYALTLVSNGASDSTLAEFEELNGSIPVMEMNEYLYELAKTLNVTKESTVNTANSVWANESLFTLSEDFITVADKYYSALARSENFADPDTLQAINGWVSEHTDGMIPKMMEKLEPSAALILLNTVLFNGKWEEPYEESDVSNGTFANYNGSETAVKFMNSTEHSYFEVDGGIGFVRAYKDDYSFIGILPDTETGIDAFVSEVSLSEILEAANSGSEKVYVSLPKFEYESEIPLKDILEKMGLAEAFSAEADLNGLGSGAAGSPYISDVFQKAKIITNENGTKAAAVTEIMVALTASRPQQEPKRIVLDRPFFYMILENKTQIPLFMGTVYSFE